jgi:hypothetical protein
VALSGSLVLILPTAAHAVVSNSPDPGTPQFNGEVRSLVHKGDTIYAAGDFTTVTDARSREFARDGLAAISASTGRVLSWAPSVAGTVRRLVAAKEGVYVVGDFTRIAGQRQVDVARLDRVTGRVDPAFNHRSDGVVNAIALSKRKVYLGGQFTSIDGRPRAQLAAVGRKGSSRLRGWAPRAGAGPVVDLVRKKAGVYVAGSFHTIQGTGRSFLALLAERDGALVRSFKSRVNNVVLDITVSGKRLYAGTGGALRGGGLVGVRRRNGSVAFERRLDGDVQAVTTLKGVVYAGGHFTAVCRVNGAQDDSGNCVGGPEARRFRGASLTGDGDLTRWNPRLNPELANITGIETFTTYGSSRRLFIGGGFTTSAGTPAARFASYTDRR